MLPSKASNLTLRYKQFDVIISLPRTMFCILLKPLIFRRLQNEAGVHIPGHLCGLISSAISSIFVDWISLDVIIQQTTAVHQ